MGRFDPSALIRKVDLLTLKIFLTVVEEGQLARAASREHIVPSAVTKRIQELEELIGIKLFHRAPKGAVLTPAGHVVARHVSGIFSAIGLMHDELGEFVGGARGHVRICANESIIVEFLANDIQAFSSQYPDIEVELMPQQNLDTLQMFATGRVDVGIFAAYGSGQPLVHGADVQEYRYDQLVAIVPPGHPLTLKPLPDLRDLVDAGLIGLRPTSPFMIHLRKVADLAGFTLRLKYEATTNESARALVRAGLGVSIQPPGVLDVEDYTRVSALPLDHDWATRRLYLAVKTKGGINVAVNTFVAHISGNNAVLANQLRHAK